MPEYIRGMLVAASIPSTVFSALFGILIWRYKKKQDKKEAAREEKEKAITDFIVMNIKATNASIAMGEAIGTAVARIPDAHCNGDMHQALEYAQKVKHEVRDFMVEQGVRHLVDD